mgnify:CR=1 FL=1
MNKLASFEDECIYYQIGNEIDYGMCDIFAFDKKKQKNIRWLKERIWGKEAEILKESVKVIRSKCHSNKPIALHLRKMVGSTSL